MLKKLTLQSSNWSLESRALLLQPPRSIGLRPATMPCEVVTVIVVINTIIIIIRGGGCIWAKKRFFGAKDAEKVYVYGQRCAIMQVLQIPNAL